jgi:hypothetical protein
MKKFTLSAKTYFALIFVIPFVIGSLFPKEYALMQTLLFLLFNISKTVQDKDFSFIE